MKIREGFLLHTMDKDYVAVPVGKTAEQFNGMVRLNETGAFVWKQLEKDLSRDEIVNAVCGEYEVDEQTAGKSVDAVIQKLREENIIE